MLGFSQVYSVFVGLVTQLCSPSNMCVEHAHTLCAYTSSLSVFTTLGTCSCSVFTALCCGCSVIKLTCWLWLVWTNSCVFIPQGNGPVGTMVLIMTGLHRIQTITSMDTCQVRKYPDSTIFMVSTILKWQMTRAVEPGGLGGGLAPPQFSTFTRGRFTWIIGCFVASHASPPPPPPQSSFCSAATGR